VIRRLFRAVFLAGVVAAGVAVVRARKRDSDPLPRPAAGPSGGPWPPLHNESPAPDEIDPTPSATTATDADAVVSPEPGGVPVADTPTRPASPSSSAPRRTTPLTGATTWAEPDAGGGCPDGFPIKAKLKSKIFHSPGQLNYDRTTPDRCYVDAAAAEADGLRPAKR
jgi:hypothetical protein